MSLFKDMLHSDESLFKNEMALDPEFVPKQLPYREGQQKYIAQCIAPLLKGRNGMNLFVYGSPGIGKTASLKWVLRDMEEETDQVEALYINCWQKNTTYKVLIEMCELLGYRFVHNKKTDELFKVIKNILNKKAAVLVFDEVDKLEDYDFLYSIYEEIFKKTMILLTNYKEWLANLDDRIKSRLSLDTLEFEKYKPSEIEGILKERIGYAFFDVWDNDAFDIIVEKAVELEDVRQGIYLLRQAGTIAEQKSSRRITTEHAGKAVESIDDYKIKKSTDLEEDTQQILDIVKDNSGSKIGDLFKRYKEEAGRNTYKTFQRKIDKLEQGKFISTYKSTGAGGNTTIVDYVKNRKLSEY